MTMKNMMTVNDKIEDRAYETKIPWPPAVPKPSLLNKKIDQATNEELDASRVTRAEYEKNLAEQKEIHKKRREDIAALEKQFEIDIATEYGLLNHPKRDIIFRMAWERGHSGGYQSVLQEYDELADLLI